METWWKEILNFGVLGIACVGLVLFILKTLKSHQKERESWNVSMKELSDNSSEAINNNTAVLYEIKGLIASLKK